MKVYGCVIDIILDMKNGVYQFAPWSGTGKTYLFKKLRLLQEAGKPIVTYTYSDYTNGVSLRELLEKTNPEVIMLDRHDMYYGDKEIINAVKKYEDKAIIMVCNNRDGIPNVKERIAEIEYDRHGIRVKGW